MARGVTRSVTRITTRLYLHAAPAAIQSGSACLMSDYLRKASLGQQRADHGGNPVPVRIRLLWGHTQ